MLRHVRDWLHWRLAQWQRDRGGSWWLQQVSGWVWKGGEECCAVLPEFLDTPSVRPSVRQSVQTFGAFSEAEDLLSLSETPAGIATQKNALKQRLFRAGNNKQPDGRQHEQSIQHNDRPEVPGEASPRYGRHPQWVEVIWRRSRWALTLLWSLNWVSVRGTRCFPETGVRVGSSAMAPEHQCLPRVPQQSSLL